LVCAFAVDVTRYKFAERGDLAYNMMRMWQGAVGVVPTDGLVSPAYVVAKPRAGVFGGYFELLFRTDDCKNEINRNSRGIVSDRNRLCWDQFKRLDVPFPPLEEQREIVLHLANTKPLCTVTTCLEREIELLREYRARLVEDVVTGRLDVGGAIRKLPTDSTEPETGVRAEDLPDEAELELVARAD
jgi:type I restriction enzyme, S subunit